ncbi:MAG: 8-amino-7-oxononanoate synthase [Planctomycetaceae bacterium]|nr:8-amino-7-oxononanoate synthase [Planctomycetaceae bacterium]
MPHGRRSESNSDRPPSRHDTEVRGEPLTRLTSLPWLDADLDRLSVDGLRRRRREITPLLNGWCEVEGQRLLNFASNDYLNLAHHPQVVEAARQAASEAGAGSGASALVTGRTPWHVRLENALAEFEGQETAILFPTGYAANVGTIAALCGEQDVVYCDRLNHASLIDGCRLSGAAFRVYRHDDLIGLRSALERGTGFRRRWIITDGVFSMDGDVAPLPALCDLAEHFNAQVLVDEAHGTGIFGTNGRGVAEHQGVEHRVAVRVGTLSKAIGSLGGFVAGPQVLIDWLWNSARTQIFSTALPPSCCAAACAALEIIRSDPARAARLHDHATRLREALSDSGLHLPHGVAGPIVPVILDDPERAVRIAAQLEARGFLVAAIRPPTVPRGTSRLRITISAGHEAADIERLAAAVIEEVRKP